MGHIVTDRIEDAWKKMNTAENLIDAGQTYAGVMKCENALQELFKSANSFDEDMWFAPREQVIRGEITQLKRVAEPDEEDVRELVSDVRSLIKDTRDHVVPVINEKIDYETTARLRER